MKWRNLGLIFDPHDHVLPHGCKEFAQSPQALVFSDRVRIYFSTRSVDPRNGKFLSRVAFVDMDKRLETILGVSAQEVLALGALGSFDEHGIFPFSVMQDGGRIVAYTCGWSRRQSVSVETGTGFVVSDDNGLTFSRFGDGPIMGASLHEPFLVGDSFVRRFGDRYHMWYIAGLRWVRERADAPPDRVYKIRYASSDDGLNWIKKGTNIITDVIGVDECQALPSVIQIDDTYHMVFCYRDVFGFRTDKTKGYRLGYASSKDLKAWVRDDQKLSLPASSEGWDSDMRCYPHFFEVDGRVYLLYNGNQFGRSGFGAALLES